MATVPIAMIVQGGNSSQTGTAGWRLRRQLTSPTDVCNPLTGGVLNWSVASAATDGMSIDPSAAPPFSGFSTPAKYLPATITYPGNEFVNLSGFYHPSSSTAYTHTLGYFNSNLINLILGYKNMDASVDNPLSEDAIVTLNLRFLNADVAINGAQWFKLFDRVQVRAGGVTQEVLSGGLTKTGNYESSSSGTVQHATTLSLDALVISRYESAATFTFPLSAIPVEIRLGTPYGQWQPWNTIRWVPAGEFKAVLDGDELTLDARGVYVVGGSIKTGNGLRWRYNSNYSSLQALDTDRKLETVDVSDLPMPADFGSSDEDSVYVTLTAESAAGCVTTFPGLYSELEESDHISAMADHDGVGYAAVKESDALMVKQYTAGKASEVVRATLPGFDSPSLYQLSDSTRFYLSARDTATGEYAFFYSDDHCKTFAEVS